MVKWLVMMVYDTAADTINAVITIVLFLCEFLLTFDSFYCLWAASLDRGSPRVPLDAFIRIILSSIANPGGGSTLDSVTQWI